MARAEAAVASSLQVIAVDLLRTFPSHPWFSGEGAPMIEPLRRVLHAFTSHSPRIGYCQGLNFVAGLLLLHCDEADAFALLATLCSRLLPGFHTPEMEGLHAAQVSATAVAADGLSCRSS